MIPSQWIDFVRANLNKYPIDSLKQALVKAGASQQDAEEAARLAVLPQAGPLPQIESVPPSSGRPVWLIYLGIAAGVLCCAMLFYTPANLAATQLIASTVCRWQKPEACYATGNFFTRMKCYKLAIYTHAANCMRGAGNSCLTAGTAIDSTYPELANKYIQAACQQRYPTACRVYSEFLLRESGGAFAKDSQTFHFMENMCRAGEMDACWYTATMLFEIKHYQEAYSQFINICQNLNDFNSCLAAGRLFRRDGQPNYSVSLFQSACRGGIQEACQEISNVSGYNTIQPGAAASKSSAPVYQPARHDQVIHGFDFTIPVPNGWSQVHDQRIPEGSIVIVQEALIQPGALRGRIVVTPVPPSGSLADMGMQDKNACSAVAGTVANSLNMAVEDVQIVRVKSIKTCEIAASNSREKMIGLILEGGTGKFWNLQMSYAPADTQAAKIFQSVVDGWQPQGR